MSQTPNIAAAAVRKPSLRERLVLRIMVPLTLTWVIGSGLAIGVAYFFAQKAFDRSLLDDAYVVASHVKSREGELYLELNAMEMSTVLFDQSEKVFFTVLRPDGSVVAGHPGLRATVPANAGRIFLLSSHTRVRTCAGLCSSSVNPEIFLWWWPSPRAAAAPCSTH